MSENSPEITFDELMAEIDRLEIKTRHEPFTGEQLALLKRGLDRGVTWETLCKWFNGKYGTTYKPDSMRSKYHSERER